MSRRALFGLILGRAAHGSSSSEPAPPNDLAAMNVFADRYNTYAEGLKNNIVDLKLWQRVAKAWQAMTSGY